MGSFVCAAMTDDKERIAAAIGKLPPEYVRKVCIYAETLLQIFESRTA